MSDPEPIELDDPDSSGYTPPTLESLDVQVARLTAAVGALGEQVDRLSLTHKSDQGPDPIDWASISGPERATAWQQLGAFVEGVVSRYNLQEEILPCWWRHGEAVEELTSLWQARLVAYAPGSDASMASWWQDLFERSRMRLREVQVLCRHGHVTPEAKPWMTAEERAEFAAAETGFDRGDRDHAASATDQV